VTKLGAAAMVVWGRVRVWGREQGPWGIRPRRRRGG
jgi:hypothetical protein